MPYDKDYRPPPLAPLQPPPLEQERRRDPRYDGGPGVDFVALSCIWLVILLSYLGYSAGGAQGAKFGTGVGVAIMFVVRLSCQHSGFYEQIKEENPSWVRVANYILWGCYGALAVIGLTNANYLHWW